MRGVKADRDNESSLEVVPGLLPLLCQIVAHDDAPQGDTCTKDLRLRVLLL